MSEQEVMTVPGETHRKPWPGKSFILNDDLRRQLIESLLIPEHRKIAYEEFLAWADEDMLAEWVDGGVVVTSPASFRHQNICGFLESVLRSFAEARDLGVVCSAPFQMKLEHGREPDLLFVAREHLDRVKEVFLDGPADLVVEIVSPDSLERDRGAKFYEYEKAGIPEYWLVDPLRQRVEFYQLDAEARYRLVEPDAQNVYHSAVLPDLRLRVEWLWHTPPVLQALRELQVI